MEGLSIYQPIEKYIRELRAPGNRGAVCHVMTGKYVHTRTWFCSEGLRNERYEN